MIIGCMGLSAGEGMRFFVGITDRDWFDFLSRLNGLAMEICSTRPKSARDWRDCGSYMLTADMLVPSRSPIRTSIVRRH
jgi:hypothetical protein